MRVVALAGGVGGAKLAHGLALILPPELLTIIVNTADDFEHLGLRISPDLDTVCYTLGGLANKRTGWGRAEETWNSISAVAQLGGPDWFRLGDKDLGTNLERTRRLRQGQTLSSVVEEFCQSWGIRQRVLPMSDDPVQTILETNEGTLGFQEYFVHRACRPRVKSIHFEGIAAAAPAPGVLDALRSADWIVLCPSNPWLSIGPILAINGVRAALGGRDCVAVSPIIAGRAVRGPADKIYQDLGRSASALEVAIDYKDFLRAFILDRSDTHLEAEIRGLGIRILTAATLMRSIGDRRRLAREILDFLSELQ